MNKTMQTKHSSGSAPHPEPLVNVERHQPDLDDPAAGVWHRIKSFAGQPPTGLYLNPIGTVSCEAGTPGFFRAARKLQSRWCQRYKAQFGQRALRSVKTWVTWKGFQNREARFWDRAACFIGILLVNDTFIPPHRWPDRNRNGQHRRHTRHRANAKKPRQSLNDSIPPDSGNVREVFVFD